MWITRTIFNKQTNKEFRVMRVTPTEVLLVGKEMERRFFIPRGFSCEGKNSIWLGRETGWRCLLSLRSCQPPHKVHERRN